MSKRCIVTIGRQYGSGGRHVGELLSQRLGFPFYDQPELIAAARRAEDYDDVRAFFEEDPADTLLTALAARERSRWSEAPFRHIRDVVGAGSCVLVGRCGSVIFRDDPTAARVFFHARPAYRVERIARMEGCSARRAGERMEETDRSRGSFHRYYTGEPWGVAEGYDLSLDSGLLGVEGSTEFLMEYLKRRGLI